MAIGAWFGLRSSQPPGEDRGGFSTERALVHVDAIAQAPRPMGSAEHDRVRDYLVEAMRAAGLDTSVQRANVAWNAGWRVHAAEVENIVALREGSDSSRGVVLLVAHYDSTRVSPGAADNGAAVAALLEVARVLATSPTQPAGVAMLFTDGEERGLLGARAFVAEHPLFDRVETVLNFDARGSSGAVMMFETSSRSLELVRAFGASGAPVFAASYAQAVYRALPNDTDFSVFRDAGKPGLNFAFFDGARHYHAPSDSLAKLSPASLRHQGLYALSLARVLAARRPPATDADAVFFVVPVIGLVVYSTTLAVILGVLGGALTLAALLIGIRSRRLEGAGVIKGAGSSLAVLAAVVAVGTLLASVAAWLADGAEGLGWELLDVCALGFGLVLLVGCCVAARVVLRWVSPLEWRAGAVLVANALAVWTAVALPAASYLVSFPALTAALALLACVQARKLLASALVVVTAFVGSFFWVPLVGVLSVAIGAPVVIVVALALGLIAPVFARAPRSSRMCGVLLVLGSALSLIGFWGDTKAAPREDSLFYAVDLDAGQAVWASFDPALDPWTAQTIQRPEAREMNAFFLRGIAQTTAAPLWQTPGPRITVLHDERRGKMRRLHMRVQPGGAAELMTINAHAVGGVHDLTIEGARPTPPVVTGARQQQVRYVAPAAAGIELELEVGDGGPLHLELVETRAGWPSLVDLPRARPADVIPSRTEPSDISLIRRELTL